jgi:hypothetical protein
MTYTQTRTQANTVTITETRVRAVLRQINVDMFAAVIRGFASKETIEKWKDDLFYMLSKEIEAAWRYEVSSDGSLTTSDRGGGINFYDFPNNSILSLAIKRQTNLPNQVNEEINCRGWTSSVKTLTSNQTKERSYSKDGYGVTRHRLNLE